MFYVLQREQSELRAPGVNKSQAPSHRGACICWSPLGYLLRVNFMKSGILNWRLQLGKICVPLVCTTISKRRHVLAENCQGSSLYKNTNLEEFTFLLLCCIVMDFFLTLLWYCTMGSM